MPAQFYPKMHKPGPDPTTSWLPQISYLSLFNITNLLCLTNLSLFIGFEHTCPPIRLPSCPLAIHHSFLLPSCLPALLPSFPPALSPPLLLPSYLPALLPLAILPSFPLALSPPALFFSCPPSQSVQRWLLLELTQVKKLLLG